MKKNVTLKVFHSWCYIAAIIRAKMKVLLLNLLVVIACMSVTTSLTIRNRQKRGLREILNSNVAYAEFYARKSRDGKGFRHYGVVVTTTSGNRWLVHKGFGFSRSSASVVTHAKHMSKRWRLVQKQKVHNVKVVDYLKAAGRYFHPVHDNAFHAVKRMMKLGKKQLKGRT